MELSYRYEPGAPSVRCWKEICHFVRGRKLKDFFTKKRIDAVLESRDKDEDEGRVGHLDGVRQKLKVAANPRLHPAGLERPGRTLGKQK